MKRFKTLIILLLIIAGGIFMTSCNSSPKVDSNLDLKELTDCLTLTKNTDSLEAEVTSKTEGGGQSINLKINMQIEDMKNNFKSKVVMDMADTHQELFMALDAGNANVYSKDDSGKYTVTSVDSSKMGEMDITRSFDSYIDIIKKDPGLFSKTGRDTYKMIVPKEKTSEYYSKITGKTTAYIFETLIIEFVIGDDDYLQNVNLKATYNSINIDMTTKYFNYGKKFNIELPEVSD